MEEWQAEIGPQVPTARNAARRLAGQIAGRLPVVYEAGFLAAVAKRWKTQFNENGKHRAFFEVLPELNHNAVVGFGNPQSVRERVIVRLQVHLTEARGACIIIRPQNSMGCKGRGVKHMKQRIKRKT